MPDGLTRFHTKRFCCVTVYHHSSYRRERFAFRTSRHAIKMLSKIILLSTLCNIVFASASSCPPNEIFSLCGNIGCQNTCKTPSVTSICREKCEPGCVCDNGYLRNSFGVCVPSDKCETCEKNQRFYSFGNCFSNCAGEEINCIYDQEGGCGCKEGFVINWRGQCVKKEECPKCEGVNEFFSCGSACDTTCDTLGEHCQIFNIKCNEMCYCKKGYARNSNGTCVTIQDCPIIKCNKDLNATYAICKKHCEPACYTKTPVNNSCDQIKTCDEGCECKPGFSLNKDGKCVYPHDCDFQCGANEEYADCPPLCPPETSCRSLFSGIQYKCAVTLVCKPKCRCKDGYVRNNEGACVIPDMCCEDPNSKLMERAKICSGGTCAKPEVEDCRTTFPYGCQCKPGHVKLSEYHAKCVPIESCIAKN